MSNYYSKRDAKVRIANELSQRGWKIYGFKEDESDLMTDYYSPANWDGIATKNGYTLVIDNKYCCYSEKEITKFNPNYKAITEKDQQRIENLKDITVLRGATIGEEENAKSMIQKIEAKYSNEGVSRYEVIDRYPKYQKNSKGCIWHIEKDGALVDRGNKLTVFADVPEPYIFDINKMEFEENFKFYEDWECNEETGNRERVRRKRELSKTEEKAIKEFKTFILRLERAVNGMNSCGDGTEETEKEGLKQQNKKDLKKVTETVVKKVLEMQQIERKESLKVGDIFFENGYGNLKVIEVTENIYKVVKLGSKSRGYQESKAKNANTSWNKKSVDNAVKNGYLKIYNIVEIEKTEIIEKWVRIRNNSKKDIKKEVNNKTNNKEELKNINNDNIEVTYNEEKNGIEIKFNEKPEQKIIDKLKANGFRWHRAKKVWYAKDTEERRNFINSLIENKEESINIDENFLNEEENDNLYNDSEKIESGFIFDCHFKEWDLSIEEIKEKLETFNIDKYYLGGDKFIFNNLSYDEIMTVKAINDINKNILFIDKKEQIKEDQEENNIINLEEKKEGIKEMNNNFNFDDIMSKFDNIEIKNENRLNSEDLAVMEELQNNLDNMREKFKLYLDFYENNTIYDIENKEVKRSIYDLKTDFIKEIIFKECNNFISKVYYYFKNKYNVTFEVMRHDTDFYLEGREKRAKENLNWFMNELNYNLLLDDIFNQLGGFDFESKSIEELKDEFKYTKPIVKGNNITLKSFIRFDSINIKYGGDYNISYYYRDKIEKLFKLLEIINKQNYKNLLEQLQYKSNELVLGIHELNGKKIKSLQIFKNGNIKLTFSSGIEALKIAKEYLNYNVSA